MLNKKEISWILAVTLVLAFTISLFSGIYLYLYAALIVFLILLVNIIAKKVAAFFLDSEIEIKLWEINRFGFHPSTKLKRPFPIGVFFPFIISIISLGLFTWMACLVFDVKAKVYRAAKRYGLYTFSEMTESHIGLIAAAGILANLIAAIIAYLINFPDFARYSIYFAVFNLVPFADLDGNKIFFGSLLIWTFLTTISLIGLGYALYLL